MDLLLGQRIIVRYLAQELAQDLEGKDPRDGFRPLWKIALDTGISEDTTRRHCDALKRARYLIGEVRDRHRWFRAVDALKV